MELCGTGADSVPWESLRDLRYLTRSLLSCRRRRDSVGYRQTFTSSGAFALLKTNPQAIVGVLGAVGIAGRLVTGTDDVFLPRRLISTGRVALPGRWFCVVVKKFGGPGFFST